MAIILQYMYVKSWGWYTLNLYNYISIKLEEKIASSMKVFPKY